MSRGIVVIEKVLEGIVLADIVLDAEVYSGNKFKHSEVEGCKPTDWIEEYLGVKILDTLMKMISNRMLRDYAHTIDVLVQEKVYTLLVEYYKLRKLFAFSEGVHRIAS